MSDLDPKAHFKDPTTGNWITQGLFFETAIRNKDYVQFTTKEHDHEVVIDGVTKVLPSLKRIYLEMRDPTEYIFATTVLGGWKHWKRICENKLFTSQIEEWREELDILLQAEALMTIAEHAKTDKGFQAAKYLADKGWEPKKRGAPSKEEKQRELKVQARVEKAVGDDLARIIPIKRDKE